MTPGTARSASATALTSPTNVLRTIMSRGGRSPRSTRALKSASDKTRGSGMAASPVRRHDSSCVREDGLQAITHTARREGVLRHLEGLGALRQHAVELGL